MIREKLLLLLCSLCPGLACPAATGDYKLASGTEGTTNAVYRNDSGILVKYEAGLWFFGSADGSQSYYFAESPQSYHPADASLWQLDDDGVEPVPQVAKVGSSSSSSSATVAETDVVVSGAGESGCNGVYSLVSGTHGTQNAVYLKGQYVVRFDSTSSKWTIRVSHPGLDIPLYSGVTLDASDPWSTDYAVETGTGPVPNVAPGVPASSSSSSSSSSEESSSTSSSSSSETSGTPEHKPSSSSDSPEEESSSSSSGLAPTAPPFIQISGVATAEGESKIWRRSATAIREGSDYTAYKVGSSLDNDHYSAGIEVDSEAPHFVSVNNVPILYATDGSPYPKDGIYNLDGNPYIGTITITHIWDSPSSDSSNASN